MASRFAYPDQIPTMISHEERQYLWRLAASTWTDAGHIVEMGPWLGGSTVCLAEGIRARTVEPRHRLHTFDNFVWRAFMSDRADLGLDPGQSFEAAFRANVAPYRDLVVVANAWLPDETIDGDPWAADVRGDGSHGELFRWRAGPVEIVFVDGAKSWSGLRHLLGELAPNLTDDALLVFQDYKYWGSYWVPMMCELLAEELRLVHVLPENTVAFRAAPTLPVGDLGALPPADVGMALLARAARRLRERGDLVGASIVLLSSVRFLAHSGETDASVEALRRCSRQWPRREPASHVQAVRTWLECYTGREVALPRERSRAVVHQVRTQARRAARRVRAQALPSASR